MLQSKEDLNHVALNSREAILLYVACRNDNIGVFPLSCDVVA